MSRAELSLLALGLAGCSRQGVEIVCSDGARLVVIASPTAVQLRIGDTTRTLAPVSAASGARFSDGAITYWSKGDEALLMSGDSVIHRACKPAAP